MPQSVRLSVLFTLLILVSACGRKANPLQVVRAAFDVGSGSTRVLVARVDLDSQIIVETLFPKSPEDVKKSEIAVGYESARLKAGGRTLPKSILDEGTRALEQLKNTIAPFKVQQYAGVATAAFRYAENGTDAVQTLSANTGIGLRVISQTDEAELGFVGALQKVSIPSQSLIVWDIGAGSTQITQLVRGGLSSSFAVFQGAFGANAARDVMVALQGKMAGASPNPVSAENARGVSPKLRVLAQQAKADPIQGFPLSDRTRAEKRVVGIGGVLNRSVVEQLGRNPNELEKSFRMADVDAAIQRQLGRTDLQIGGRYATTQVTNLLLVKAFMEELGFDEVIPLSVNLANAVLVAPSYWPLPRGERRGRR